MKIVDQINEWREIRRSFNSSARIGFVPTMGNLHAGHASLFQQSKHDNDITVASLFINPTQFNQAEDFKNYPRTLENDLGLLRDEGVDYCFLPHEEEIYHDKYCYQIHDNGLSQIMEGKHRPGHFNGVLTVVMKLLNIIQPTHAYFGEKDYQQYQLIQGMVDAFFMPVKIKACPTIREKSGLAFSSRNNRLTTDQRQTAEQFAQAFHQAKPCETLIKELQALGMSVDYLEDYQNRRYVAAYIGDIRLIDNYALDT